MIRSGLLSRLHLSIVDLLTEKLRAISEGFVFGITTSGSPSKVPISTVSAYPGRKFKKDFLGYTRADHDAASTARSLPRTRRRHRTFFFFFARMLLYMPRDRPASQHRQDPYSYPWKWIGLYSSHTSENERSSSRYSTPTLWTGIRSLVRKQACYTHHEA